MCMRSYERVYDLDLSILSYLYANKVSLFVLLLVLFSFSIVNAH